MQKPIYVSEQHRNEALDISEELKTHFSAPAYPRRFKLNVDNELCFSVFFSDGGLKIDTNYFIGVDWIIEDKVSLYVEPKLNRGSAEVDFLAMLIESLEARENFHHLDDLFEVDYDRNWIPIPQQKDLLSPILIVQFLKLLQHIVRRGLKKSYYQVTSNLKGKIKGKILVGQQIRQNIFKNRLTGTVCRYQEFGENTPENRLLKSVMAFVRKYVHQSDTYFTSVQKSGLVAILNYCEPAFEHIDPLGDPDTKIHVRKNVFYKDYEEAIRIGGFILKKFSYNISKISGTTASTPPFWIDMSKLFELYVFKKLKSLFPRPGEVSYHDNHAGGKQTDILLKAWQYRSVIDCKYKPRYQDNNPSLEDKRQLAGYTRQKGIYDKLKIPYNEVVKGIIIYSSQQAGLHFSPDDLFKKPIAEYVDFYKMGVALPELDR